MLQAGVARNEAGSASAAAPFRDRTVRQSGCYLTADGNHHGCEFARFAAITTDSVEVRLTRYRHADHRHTRRPLQGRGRGLGRFGRLGGVVDSFAVPESLRFEGCDRVLGSEPEVADD